MKRVFIVVALLALVPQTQASASTVRAIRKALPSVVKLIVPKPGGGGYVGTGVIIKSNGLIVTNAHIAARGKKIKVYLTSGKIYWAKRIGLDWSTDIGLIKITARRRFPVARLGKYRRLRLGQTVICIGNPYRLSYSVTKGIISAFNRTLRIKGLVFKHLIQTDAALNPGNSGGPMINLRGKVVGIAMAIVRGANNIGFVIPIHIVKKSIKKILRNRHKRIRLPAKISLPPYMRKFLPIFP